MTSSIPPNWPQPLRLLCACLGAHSPDLVSALARDMSPRDWDRFVWLATERHRVAPRIPQDLTASVLPPDVAEALAARVKANATQTLVLMAETRRVHQALSKAGIDPVIFKGWPLSERLFNTSAARHSGDLDLAIAPRDLPMACTVMEDCGYAADGGQTRLTRIGGGKAMMDEGKDFSFIHPAGHKIDLHWHLLPYRGWPRILDLPGAVTRQVTQAGTYSVLSDQANMLYLPIHGGLHLWTRLKWLTDIAPLAVIRGTKGLTDDLALARRLGVGRSLDLGLRLSARLFGSPLPDGLDLVPPGRTERFMLDTIARDDMIPVISPRYRFWTRINALRLAQGPRQIWGVIRYDTLRRWRWRLVGMQKRS